jgi:hypothetical protein
MRFFLEGVGHMASNELADSGRDSKWDKFFRVSGVVVEVEQVHIGSKQCLIWCGNLFW